MRKLLFPSLKGHRFTMRVMVLAAFVLVAHSLDVCSSHLGFSAPTLSNQLATVTHNGVQCTARAGEACLCAGCACVPLPMDSNAPPKDACESTSEVAVRSHSVGFDLETPLIELPNFASVPEVAEPTSPLAAFLGSNGPSLARLRSQFLSYPLSGRAPPISA